MRPLFIDGFAGGGGASTGIAQAIGRDVDIAINHSPSAIAIHKANHPGTEHHCQDIRAVWPRVATRDRHVAGAWFSPDCKEFSKAKGGSVKERHIRMLAMEIPHWLDETQPDVVYVENVEEFEDWGPLEEGADGKWRVITALKGEDFKKWLRLCRRAGYRCDHRQLRACNYGAPTSRKRLYIIMRRDKKPIVWAKATHGPPDSPGVRSGKLLPYRTAAECIDWTIPTKSIFDRKKPLASASNRRIAHGTVRYVIEAAKRGKAYIVRTDGEIAPHITKFRTGSVGSPIDKEMPTVTANGQPTRPAGATPLGLVGATLYRTRNGEREGQAPRALDPQKPLGVVAAEASGFGLAVAHLEKFNADSRPRPVGEPLDTVMASSAQHGLVETRLAEVGFIDRQFSQSLPRPANEPLGATTTQNKSAAVTAFLTRFYGSDKTNAGGDPEQPLGTARAGGQHHGIVAAHMAQFNTNPSESVNVGHAMDELVSTVATKGPHQGVIETTLIDEGALPPQMLERAVKVAAFLVKYYGEGGQDQALDRPLDVVTTRARYAVVTVIIDAITYVIVDIGLRMLKPRELARAQGFPEGYILDPIVRKFLRGKWVMARLTIAEQISAIGNSVCPQVACALVRANQPHLIDWEDERLAA